MQHKTFAIAVSLLNSRITCHTHLHTYAHTHANTHRAWQCPRANSNSIPEHKLKLISIIWKCGAHKSQELNFQLSIREERETRGESESVWEKEIAIRREREREMSKQREEASQKLTTRKNFRYPWSYPAHNHLTNTTHSTLSHTHLASHTHKDMAALLTFVSSRSLKQTKCE